MTDSAKTSQPAATQEIATLRLELAYTEPLIWREAEIPVSVSLESLHDIVQALMNWDNSHLWEFTIAKQRFGPPSDEDWGEPAVDAGKVILRDVLKPRKTAIDYLYDFGDSWEHKLTITKVRAGEPGVSYPRYTGGAQNAPPEDCGGVHGFYTGLEVLGNKKHPQHKDIVEWWGPYNPQKLDEKKIGTALAGMAIYFGKAQARLANKAPPKKTVARKAGD